MGAQVFVHGTRQGGVTVAAGGEAVREGAHRLRADPDQPNDTFRILVLDGASLARLDDHVRNVGVQTEPVRCRAGRLGRTVACVDHAQKNRERLRVQRHQRLRAPAFRADPVVAERRTF